MAFISDNCNTMVGKRNSAVTKIKEKNSALFDIGYVCHLANLYIVAGVNAFPVPVENLLMDVFYHFQVIKFKFIFFNKVKILELNT